ncbi:hypothetical protein [Legionella maioricensis]|uniref:Dot/Icm secretion system substrate n=1 Tax=Legionella maioricensis TaxID=2896528 RepID=A0A9X2CYX4_9GAMM|nr:hypothetical protein [Legionella maioricensis]MCL9683088.1 hypothetical protein [Legionella maioricensis]MCL9686436.1 hypothetical protein [Legionella maioricensis]
MQAKEEFKNAIEEATPTLERDLGWGDYLKNLFKKLANIVMSAVRCGGEPSTFFAIERSSLAQAVDAAKTPLDNAAGEDLDLGSAP